MRTFMVLVLIYFFSNIVFAQALDDEELRTKNNYKSTLFELGTGYKAKLYCSCLFQMKLSKQYCKKFVSVQPEVFSVDLNSEKKTVEARALLFFHSVQANFVDDESGCFLK